MRTVAALVLCIILAGCTDPPIDDGTGDGGPDVDAWECDYELDDYASGQPRLMVHWDVDGDRAMSGIAFQVHLLMDGDIVATHTTTTDCSLFDMTDLDTDQIVVNPEDPSYCDWGAVVDHAYHSDFETVRVELEWMCG